MYKRQDLRGALNRIRAHTDRLNDTGWLGLEDGDSRVKIILIHVTELAPENADGTASALAAEGQLLEHGLAVSGRIKANVNKAGAGVYLRVDGSMWFYAIAATMLAGERGRRNLALLAKRAGTWISKYDAGTDAISRGVDKKSLKIDKVSLKVDKKSRGVAKHVAQPWDDALRLHVEKFGPRLWAQFAREHGILSLIHI